MARRSAAAGRADARCTVEATIRCAVCPPAVPWRKAGVAFPISGGEVDAASLASQISHRGGLPVGTTTVDAELG